MSRYQNLSLLIGDKSYDILQLTSFKLETKFLNFFPSYRYLVEHQGSSAETQDLWKALNFGLVGDGPRVEEVMDLWTTWKGFPRIKVKYLKIIFN